MWFKRSFWYFFKNYNNHIHITTKYKYNYIFYSNSSDLYEIVLGNIKASFRNIGKEFNFFEFNEKCFLKRKFKIQRKFKKDSTCIIVYDRFKYKQLYFKINVFIKDKSSNKFIIMIDKKYDTLFLIKANLNKFIFKYIII